MNMIRAVAYARYSSDNQRDESIDAQLKAIHSFAEQNKMAVINEYIDRAKSATSDNRPEFLQMIEDAKKSKFDVVIVHKLDRFARNRYDSAKYKFVLNKNNIKLLSVIEHLDGSPESVILESMLEGMAEYYSKDLAREVMKGTMENAEKCMFNGGRPPLGYKINSVNRQYEINTEEAAAIKTIFQMTLEGGGYTQIIKYLNEHGYKTRTGNPFGKNSIYEILKNEKYKGVYIYNRSSSKSIDNKRNNHQNKVSDEVVRIEGGVPPLISTEQFDLVQSILNKRKYKNACMRGTQRYLLTGKMVCGTCGSSYVGNSKRSGRNKTLHVTYRCNRRSSKTSVICCNKEIRREYIESFVLKCLADLLFNEKSINDVIRRYEDYARQKLTSKNVELKNMQKSIGELDKKIGNLVDAIAVNGLTSLTERLGTLEHEKEILKIRIEQEKLIMTNSIVDKEKVRETIELARKKIIDGSLESVQYLINMFVNKVVIFVDYVEAYFNVFPLLIHDNSHTGMSKMTTCVAKSGGGEGS